MFKKMNVPVLGVVENMTAFIPHDQPGKEYKLFGSGGGFQLANENDIPLLAQIPMEMFIHNEQNDGKPIVIAHPESITAKRFISLANSVMESVSQA